MRFTSSTLDHLTKEVQLVRHSYGPRRFLGILIPMLILSICNCSLIKALRRSNRMRRHFRVQPAANNSSKRITLTLIVIMIAFLILVFPSEIMDLFADQIRKNQTEVFLTVRAFANVFQIINFAFNFILYCVVNVHFRGMLLQMLPCCHKLFPGVLAKFQRSVGRGTIYRTSFSSLSQGSSTRRASDIFLRSFSQTLAAPTKGTCALTF